MPSDIYVEVDASEVSNGDTIDFGSAAKESTPTQKSFVITNNGNSELTIQVPDYIAGWDWITKPSTSVAASMQTTAILKTYTDIPRVFSSEFKLVTNDPNALSFVMTLTSTITSDEVLYCDRDDLQRKFGTENVNAWSDLNGAREENHMEETCYEFILDAMEHINACLEGTYYVVPFSEPVPRLIRELCCIYAMRMLYQTKGISHPMTDKLMSVKYKYFKDTLVKIQTGRIKFTDQDTNTTGYVPMVVKDEE